MTFIFTMIFIFGCCIGSFSNVCILRWIKEESVIMEPSHCFYCKNQIKWYDNIPIISYLFLRGKCRNCHEHISLQYPVIELITGLVYLSIFYMYGFSWMSILLMFVSWLFIVATTTDIINREIPNELILVGLVMVLINGFIGTMTIGQILFGLCCPSVVLLFIGLLCEKITGVETAVGGGDIKFLFIIGGLMGAEFSTAILLLGCVLLTLFYFSLFIEDVVSKKRSYVPMMVGFALAYIYILLFVYLQKPPFLFLQFLY